jgi:NADH dehydrogenase FAD-containing subunit
MRNPIHPEVFAVGDAAALTLPKLGSLGHQQAEITAIRSRLAGRAIARIAIPVLVILAGAVPIADGDAALGVLCVAFVSVVAAINWRDAV